MSPVTFAPVIRVPTRVVRMHMRVDDVLQRLVGRQLVDGRDHLVGTRREAGIHDEHAHLAHLNRDVATRAHQHVDVALHRKNVNFVVGGIGILRHVFLRHRRHFGERQWILWRRRRILYDLLELGIHRFRSA
jgi:hypothetical protein